MDGDVCAGPAKAKRAKPAASRVMWTAHKHKGNNKVKTDTEVTIQQHTHIDERKTARTHIQMHTNVPELWQFIRFLVMTFTE